MRSILTLLVLVVLLCCPALADEQKQAVAKAKSILRKIDAGQYKQAYQNASKILKSQVDETQFAEGIEAAKEQMGPLTARSFNSAKHHTALPSIGEGDFFILKWNSSFEKLVSGSEVMILSRERGSWKMVGYGMTP